MTISTIVSLSSWTLPSAYIMHGSCDLASYSQWMVSTTLTCQCNSINGLIVRGRELYCLRAGVYGSYTMAVTQDTRLSHDINAINAYCYIPTCTSGFLLGGVGGGICPPLETSCHPSYAQCIPQIGKFQPLKNFRRLLRWRKLNARNILCNVCRPIPSSVA